MAIKPTLILQEGIKNLMAKRVTIMIDEDLDKKLRIKQAKMIQQEQTSYSYSRIVNETIRKVIK